MHTIFIFILCTALTFTHTNTSFDLTHQKAAGVAVLTIVGGGILYLVKSTKDMNQEIEVLSQQIAEHKTKMAIREEALQNFKNASAQAIKALRKIKARLQIENQPTTPASASSLQDETEQDPVTFQDLEALIKYGQAMERLQTLINETESELSKTSHDLK